MTGPESSTVKALDEARRRRGACGTLGGFFPPHTARQVVVAAVAAAVTLAGAFSACAAPYVPADDAQVLERLPSAGNQNLRELRRLHADLARNPGDLALAIRVATQDIEAARAESDPRYNGYAEAALGPWIALPSPPNAVLLLRATLRQATHDFHGALEDLNRVISTDPRNLQARLTRAIILQVVGEYPDALKNCFSLALFADNLVTATCIASVNGLNGHAQASREALQDVLDRVGADESPQLRLWALTILAEIDARAGDGVAAERHFRQALGLGLRDGYLLGAYADFLLDTGRPQEVLALLQNEWRIDALLLRLALAEQMLGTRVLPQHIFELNERFQMSRLRGDTSHQREEARFTLHLLKRVPEALRLAEQNWSVQHEPWDARILLEAALASGASIAARPVLEWLRTSQLEDGQIRSLTARLREVPQ
jgi:tetratricopeptide (TPR) repeat protein